MTILDASVLLAHFDGADAHAEDARRILAEADQLAASTLTLAETFVGAVAAGRLEEQLQAVTELAITEVPLGSGAGAALARLRVGTGLRMPDCCVLHAAAVTGATAVCNERRATARGRVRARAAHSLRA